MEGNIPHKWKQKRARIAILIFGKIDFQSKAVTRGKKGHSILTNGSIYQKNTVVNIYAPNIRVPKYITQILTDLK